MAQKLEGDELLHLREHVLKLLLSNYSSSFPTRYIYMCAEEWCNKQVTSNGVVGYFKAYYGKYERQEGSKENY